MIEKIIMDIAKNVIRDDLDLWQEIQEKITKKRFSLNGIGFWLSRAVVIVMLVLVIILTFSPTARAQLLLQVQRTRIRIGDMVLFEVDKLDLDEPRFMAEGDEILPPMMTVQEAQEQYDFKVPEWAPEGYRFSGEAQIYMIGTQPSIHMYWEKEVSSSHF